MQAMKFMIENAIKMCLYKLYCINKHVSSHVDDKVFKTDQIKFNVYFNQAFDLGYGSFCQQLFKKQAKIAIILLYLDVLITVWSVFFQAESFTFKLIHNLQFIIFIEPQHHQKPFFHHHAANGTL